MKIELCPGLTLPFFPMRPSTGRTLRTPKLVRDFLKEFDPEYWDMQPKLNGQRVCLATLDGRVHVQNRHGGWFRSTVKNADRFLEVGDRYCFDGEVWEGSFYPFELLAQSGKSILAWPTHERIALAKGFVLALKEPWLFDPPTAEWLMARTENMPKWEGVVLKKSHAGYNLHGSDTESSLGWFKRRWDSRRSIEG